MFLAHVKHAVSYRIRIVSCRIVRILCNTSILPQRSPTLGHTNSCQLHSDHVKSRLNSIHFSSSADSFPFICDCTALFLSEIEAQIIIDVLAA